MFRTLLLAGSALLHAYVFARAAAVPWIARRIGGRALALLAVALWAGTQLSRSLAHDATGGIAAAAELLAMDWLATLFLLAVALAFVDVVTLSGLLAPRLSPRLRGWALAAGAAMAALAVIQGMRAPVVTEHEVTLSFLPADADGLTVVAVSDLHVGTVLGPRWLAARVAQIEHLRPDLIVLLGDVVEGHGIAAEDVLPPLRRLAAPLGVWAVTGNHDRGGGRDSGADLLTSAGVTVLSDWWAVVRPGVIVAGVDGRSWRRRAAAAADPLAAALGGRAPGATILLTHDPTGAERAAARGAELMLAGHTHGGQVWPFGYLVRTAYPLLAGRYEVAGMPVIVCRGTGTWGPRMRLWRRGEILRITLRAGGVAAARPG